MPRPRKVQQEELEEEEVVDFSCQHCDKQFRSRKELMHHYYIHDKIATFKCNICTKVCQGETSLKIHMKTHIHRPSAPKCPICGEEFETKVDLEEHHRLNHLGQKAFKCEKCGLEFSWLENLKKHEAMHVIETHMCDICNRGFLDSTSLRIHMRNHQNQGVGKKKYQCATCSKAFEYDFSYKAHLTAHQASQTYGSEVPKSETTQDRKPGKIKLVSEFGAPNLTKPGTSRITIPPARPQRPQGSQLSSRELMVQIMNNPDGNPSALVSECPPAIVVQPNQVQQDQGINAYAKKKKVPTATLR